VNVCGEIGETIHLQSVSHPQTRINIIN